MTIWAAGWLLPSQRQKPLLGWQEKRIDPSLFLYLALEIGVFLKVVRTFGERYVADSEVRNEPYKYRILCALGV